MGYRVCSGQSDENAPGSRAYRLHDKGMKQGYNISIFHATGSANGGWAGDHILLAPPYIVDRSDVEETVDRVARVVRDVFEELPLGASYVEANIGINGKRLPIGVPKALEEL